jgi:hypothetical protein
MGLTDLESATVDPGRYKGWKLMSLCLLRAEETARPGFSLQIGYDALRKAGWPGEESPTGDMPMN